MTRNHWIGLCAALSIVAGVSLAGPAQAATVTEETARVVAENYIRLATARDGSWAGSDAARVASIEPFRGAAARNLGWLCHVEPVGYILVALHTDMMPVHACSDRSRLDPADTGGMTAFLRQLLESKYAAIERKLGRSIAPDDDLRSVMETSYRGSWPVLTDPTFDPGTYRRERETRWAGMDYQEGETLLESTWDQNPPYNDDCPDHGCEWGGYGNFNENVVVGCVATAMSQMLRQFEWPPQGYGSPYDDDYDWGNMLNQYVYDGAGWFKDENGVPVTQEQIDAVAELSRETGTSVDMDYGCGGSSAYMDDCEDAFEGNFYMSDGCQVWYRDDYNFSQWFGEYRSEINQNRTVGVGIPGHMVVADGWRIENIGGVDWHKIHVVYGWNGTHDGWYSPDDIAGDHDDTMVRGVRPNCVLGNNPSGTYTSDGSTWRYFDRDVTSEELTFEGGHWLQILGPGFLVTNIGSLQSDRIEFRGNPTDGNTRLFVGGDYGTGRRVMLIDGTLRVSAGGQIAFY